MKIGTKRYFRTAKRLTVPRSSKFMQYTFLQLHPTPVPTSKTLVMPVPHLDLEGSLLNTYTWRAVSNAIQAWGFCGNTSTAKFPSYIINNALVTWQLYNKKINIKTQSSLLDKSSYLAIIEQLKVFSQINCIPGTPVTQCPLPIEIELFFK